jgi:hypothetical protein
MNDLDQLMTFQLMVRDMQLGTRKPVPTPPIQGRYEAERQLERIRQANRDHRLQYDIEIAMAPSDLHANAAVFSRQFRGER